ncbi:hypothetical protein [Youngiibacter multivorans]|uniref:Uncharacterized protein n=1 Tax=Youngiibacter multivorans TaxID=937251 RepID=A0ABS4G3Z7_9CLOT|nr:hypothetical protein [Youngiibacter multivorans]MBP1919278.1 hypothetical protein [Youngiibacter multivorans]
MELFFGSTLSSVNTMLIAGIALFIALQYHGRGRAAGWGRRLLILVAAGLLVCILAAIRDNYALSVAAATTGGETGLFTVESFQSVSASLAGLTIAAVSFSAMFIRKDKYSKAAFFMVSGIFVFKLLLVEASRIVMGG